MRSNKVIGIISWLPNNILDKKKRIFRFENLLKQIGEVLPHLPIIIIAQNWNDYNPNINQDRLIIYKYNKLGILGARKELRKRFLELSYDFLIMFDDDAIIEEKIPGAAQEYLNRMDLNPNGFAFVKKDNFVPTETSINPYRDSQLNLCVVSRTLYQQEPIPNINAQNDEAFEDRIFSTLLHYKYSDLEFDVPNGLVCSHFKNPEIDKFGGEVPSTWAYEHRRDWRGMRLRTIILEQYIALNKKLPVDIRSLWRKYGLWN